MTPPETTSSAPLAQGNDIAGGLYSVGGGGDANESCGIDTGIGVGGGNIVNVNECSNPWRRDGAVDRAIRSDFTFEVDSALGADVVDAGCGVTTSS
jgi:hypothetical protein